MMWCPRCGLWEGKERSLALHQRGRGCRAEALARSLLADDFVILLERSTPDGQITVPSWLKGLPVRIAVVPKAPRGLRSKLVTGLHVPRWVQDMASGGGVIGDFGTWRNLLICAHDDPQLRHTLLAARRLGAAFHELVAMVEDIEQRAITQPFRLRSVEDE